MTIFPDPAPKILPRVSALGRLRRYFFTGLVIIAPIAISIWATLWFVSAFDGLVKPWLPSAYNPDNYLPIKVPGLGLFVALAGITLAGALAANFVGRFFIGVWDKVLNRTPVVRSIYKSSKQIFETIFSEKGSSFRNVCLVEWPRKGVWALAFVSREIDGADVGLEAGREMYSIYISTTPNPTGGYVFFADRKDVRILDMSVEDGLKLIISMGLIFPEKGLPAATLKKLSRKTKA
ncbi:MAG: DUF502 domain-containing protein [Alphaproteobacteria bacterium]|nr:DUF502 domain-containing protein [Alphaproteobacteria bacterium]